MKKEENKFEEIISRLERNDNVDASLSFGSTASQTRTASSDYDLVIIVKNKPEKLESMFASIGGVPADIFFFTTAEIESILGKKAINDGPETWLLKWLETGNIYFDRSGALTRLQGSRRDIRKTDNEPLAKTYEYKVNYNLLTNTRYFESGDELYQAALEIRLLYSLAEALVGYFAMRGIYWEGEKNAIMFLRKNDPAYLKLFETVCREVTLSDKFALYQRLAESSFFGKYKKWDKDVVASMDGEFEGFLNELLV